MICLEHLLSCPAQTGSNCLDAIVHGLPATACGAERARVYYCWLHGYFVNILNGKYIRAHRLQGRSRRVLRKKSTRPIRTLLTRPRQRIFQSSPPLLRSTASTVRMRQRPRPLKIMFNPIFRRSCSLRFQRIPGLACVKEKTARACTQVCYGPGQHALYRRSRRWMSSSAMWRDWSLWSLMASRLSHRSIKGGRVVMWPASACLRAFFSEFSLCRFALAPRVNRLKNALEPVYALLRAREPVSGGSTVFAAASLSQIKVAWLYLMSARYNVWTDS